MLVAYTSGREKAVKLIDGTLKALNVAGKPEVLLSVLGRIAARTLETKLILDEMVNWGCRLLRI